MRPKNAYAPPPLRQNAAGLPTKTRVPTSDATACQRSSVSSAPADRPHCGVDVPRLPRHRGPCVAVLFCGTSAADAVHRIHPSCRVRRRAEALTQLLLTSPGGLSAAPALRALLTALLPALTGPAARHAAPWKGATRTARSFPSSDRKIDAAPRAFHPDRPDARSASFLSDPTGPDVDILLKI